MVGKRGEPSLPIIEQLRKSLAALSIDGAHEIVQKVYGHFRLSNLVFIATPRSKYVLGCTGQQNVAATVVFP
jgi:hypothetical protein